MVKSKELIDYLKSKNLKSFLMVPCSLFKPLASWMMRDGEELIFAPNEAHALGYASGVFLATGRPAVIFLQNSGLNNIANAQTSLNYLYKIPALLFASWRGQPGREDAPEHTLMGKITQKLLSNLRIPYKVLSNDWRSQLNRMIDIADKQQRVVALLVSEGLIESGSPSPTELPKFKSLFRTDVLRIFKDKFKDSAAYISVCGFTSRESFAVSPTDDFYMLGSLGHTFSLGAGLAAEMMKNGSKRMVVVFDGDGSCLMHLGSLAFVGLKNVKESNLIYVLLDNGVYESTGGQPTLSSGINFMKVAEGLGFPQYFSVSSDRALTRVLRNLRPGRAAFVHVKIAPTAVGSGSRVSDKYACSQITRNFRRHLADKK